MVGQTFLGHACKRGSDDIVKYLLTFSDIDLSRGVSNSPFAWEHDPVLTTILGILLPQFVSASSIPARIHSLEYLTYDRK